MTRLPAIALLWCCLPLMFGCSSSGEHAADTAADTAQDTALQDADATEVPLVIGVNPTGEDDPALFTSLAEGDELEIEFGFQGLWMVVLALQVPEDTFEGLVTLFASIRTEAQTLGEFGIAKQILIPGGDGFDYYLNFFLVVVGPDDVGEEAWVEMTVEDKDGQSLEGTVQVVLTGGALPNLDDAGPPQLFPDAQVDVGPDSDDSEVAELHDSD